MDAWPQGELEALGHCPLCGSQKHTTLYEGLKDIVFKAAPGAWSLQRCNSCNGAYLDPRPSRASIGLAYRGYYTHHGVARTNNTELSLFQRLARSLANGYRNHQFGTNEKPAHRLGIALGTLLPAFRRHATPALRSLTATDRGARVLDVGCGGGNFAYWAKAMGCHVFACDPDPVAAVHVSNIGVEVRAGGIESYLDKPGFFDVITMGHVIEHLHDPEATLIIALQLLRPGGRLWLETPNLASKGFSVFGQYWRGLEVPRHLILFEPKSLSAIVERVGFENISMSPGSAGTILTQSASLMRTYGRTHGTPALRASRKLPDCETIQLIAIAPGQPNQ